MSNRELVKRYLVLLPGVFITGFGIACITKAGLGSTPISALPYTLSLIFPAITFGTYTAAFNILMALLQIPLSRGKLELKSLLIQIILSVILGKFIDISNFFLSSICPGIYSLKLVMLLCGCIIIAFGIYVQLTSGVNMSPGDSFTKALSEFTGKSFGGTRVVMDSVLTISAAGLSFAVFGKFLSAREGTIIVALIMGNIVKVCGRLFKKKADSFMEKYIIEV